MFVLLLLLLATSHHKAFLAAHLIRGLLEDFFLESDTNLDHSIQVWRVRLALACKTEISNSEKNYVSPKYELEVKCASTPRRTHKLNISPMRS
jgi:hypothetical protein